MSRWFQFNLKLPFLLLAGMAAGGQTARYIALSETPMLAGKPVSWSTLGEAIFFGIGCFAAVVGMAIAGAGPALLRIHAPWHLRDERRKDLILLIGALMIGSCSGAFGLIWLASVFFAMPREFFDVLTTRP